MEVGRLDMRLATSVTYGVAEHLAECPDLGPQCNGPVAPIPYYHHVDLIASDISFDVAYGVLPWLALEGRLTLRIVDTTPTYFEQDRTPKLVPDDIHHHDVTLVGPGDPWVIARVGGKIGDLTTAARLGFTLPLGSTVPDPYKLGEEGESHEHTQLGTGTVMPVVGLGLAYSAGPIDLSVSALGFFSVSANGYGFRAPARFFGGVRAAAPLLDGKFTPFATVDLAHETDEIWSGELGLEGNTRRTDLLLGAGIAWEFAPRWKVEASARGRALRLAAGPGFDSPGLVQLAISTYIDGLPPAEPARGR